MNQNGFGIIWLIISLVVIGVMSAMIIPTFTSKMNYKQAKYVAGVARTVINAEDAYMAKNGGYANLTALSGDGYISANFLSSLSYTSDTLNMSISDQTVGLCIDNYSNANTPVCQDEPATGNGYFIGLYGIPTNYAEYIEHELPGAGMGVYGTGTDYIAYEAPSLTVPPQQPPSNSLLSNVLTTSASCTNNWYNPSIYYVLYETATSGTLLTANPAGCLVTENGTAFPSGTPYPISIYSN